MKLLFWIVVLPLLVLSAFFAVANSSLVTVDLLPGFGAVSVPLFVALLGALYSGFLFGAMVAWWGGRYARARAREQAHRAERLQREVDALQARIESARPSPVAPPAAPSALVPREPAPTWPVP